MPPTRKYEADGGPGMAAILDLLKASDDPEADRRSFLKAQIIFWLFGATDGHAKNFSIFLQQGGRFRLTPLYDVMSVQPAFDAGQLRRNQMKFALSVGDNRHYVVYEIMPRHFVQTAAKSGVPASLVQSIFDELLENRRGRYKQSHEGAADRISARTGGQHHRWSARALALGRKRRRACREVVLELPAIRQGYFLPLVDLSPARSNIP